MKKKSKRVNKALQIAKAQMKLGKIVWYCVSLIHRLLKIVSFFKKRWILYPKRSTVSTVKILILHFNFSSVCLLLFYRIKCNLMTFSGERQNY